MSEFMTDPHQTELFRMMVDGMDQGLLLTGTDQKIGFCNVVAKHLFGIDFTGRQIDELRDRITPVSNREGHEALKGEVFVRHELSGLQARCFLDIAPLSRDDSENRNLVWSFFELTEEIGTLRNRADFSSELATLNQVLKLKNQEIARLTKFDGLTSVANRLTITELLDKALGFGAVHGHDLSVALLDIDRMVSINSRFGWKFGDSVLAEVATLATGCLGQDGTLGRWNGDEFLAVIPGADREQTRVLAEEIRTTIQKTTSGGRTPVTVSIGVTDYRQENGAQHLVASAGLALAAAKTAGRNRVVVADERSTP